MREVTVIRDYEVRAIGVEHGIARYEATHVVLPRRALIELLVAGAPREAAVMLMRRVCILDALRHPGVPRIFECGRLDGQPWYAFEDCEGVPLETELQSRRLDVAELLDVIEGVAAVLAYAHARGVCHRNITPSTILLGSDLVLTGWEHACLHDAELVRPVPGSNRFRAPEQRSGTAEERTDVYALAKVALEALAAQVAVPAELATLLARMLALDPTTRPTAAQVVTKVRALRDRASVATTPADAIPHAGLDAAIESLLDEQPEDVVLEYIAEEASEPILLEQVRNSRWTPQFATHEPRFEHAEIKPRRTRTQPRIATK